MVRREPHPDDRRAKRVVYTKKGLAAVREANLVKRAIEADYERRLGVRGFAAFRRALRAITRDEVDS